MKWSTPPAILMAMIAVCQASCLAGDRNAPPRYDFIPYAGTNGSITHMSPNGQWITRSDGTVWNAGRVVGEFYAIAQVTDSGVIRLEPDNYSDTTLAIPRWVPSQSRYGGYIWKRITFRNTLIHDVNSKGEMVGVSLDEPNRFYPCLLRLDGTRTVLPDQGYIPSLINDRGDTLWQYAKRGRQYGMMIVDRKGVQIPILDDVLGNYRSDPGRFTARRAIVGIGYASAPGKNIAFYWDPICGTKILGIRTDHATYGSVVPARLNDSGILVGSGRLSTGVTVGLIWPNPGKDQVPIELDDTVSPETSARYTFNVPIDITNQGVIAVGAIDKTTNKQITGLLVPVRR